MQCHRFWCRKSRCCDLAKSPSVFQCDYRGMPRGSSEGTQPWLSSPHTQIGEWTLEAGRKAISSEVTAWTGQDSSCTAPAGRQTQRPCLCRTAHHILPACSSPSLPFQESGTEWRTGRDRPSLGLVERVGKAGRHRATEEADQ